MLSALKESRKRSFAVVDEEEEELMRPSKRCLQYCSSLNYMYIFVN